MGKKKVITKSGGESGTTSGAAGTPGAVATTSSKKIESGKVYIIASFNNMLATITDAGGNVIAWSSAGSMGFSGPKKATPFAASKVMAALAEKVKKTGPINIDVIVRGVGGGRDAAVRSLINQGFNVTSIRDVTPIPHNGPKPKKPRRV
ncbi:MAG: 30S ribosomal protein S11 [bacterium]|nr:30S ribosomal protein S11 [bacterium]